MNSNLKFSQKYGYTPTEKVMIRNSMPIEVINSLCTAFDLIKEELHGNYMMGDKYEGLEQHLWLYFLNRRLADFKNGSAYAVVATTVLQSTEYEWYLKIDLVEMALRYLKEKYEKDEDVFESICKIVNFINGEFKRHDYSYRVIDFSIVEITSKEEIESIEKALSENKDNIRHHFSNALEAYAKRPKGDYSNSIKESISAVEALCREMTGESTLGKAIKVFEKRGMVLPSVMKEGLEKLYAYTNQPSTGIRHSLMDTDGAYIPGNEEARYMLIVCTAFINYIRSKFADRQLKLTNNTGIL